MTAPPNTSALDLETLYNATLPFFTGGKGELLALLGVLVTIEFMLVGFFKVKSVLDYNRTGYSSEDLVKRENKSKQRSSDLRKEMKQREKVYSDAHSGDESIFNR